MNKIKSLADTIYNGQIFYSCYVSKEFWRNKKIYTIWGGVTFFFKYLMVFGQFFLFDLLYVNSKYLPTVLVTDIGNR